MALVTTAAVVLHAFKYSESSKIVRLATEDVGVQSAVAKGAMRPKSKFGARLQVLSGGVAEMYMKPNRDLHTLAAFDVTRQRSELAGDVERYVTATALAELILRLAPAEPNPTVYHYLVAMLDDLVAVDRVNLEPFGLAALWGAVGILGFAPALDGCACDGRRLPDGAAKFSIADGGFLCQTCAATSTSATTLQKQDRQTLEKLVSGNIDDIAPIPPRHAAAHRRLIVRFAECHMNEDLELKALSMWERMWSDT
ncbi:MAG: DNA repair protein RecO [Gemmatimonadota bacterium]|nr:MAG: DNA repair protein RecO [Gemmatimonadota bacterium]